MAEEPFSFALAPKAGRTSIAAIRIIAQQIDFLGFIGLPPFVQWMVSVVYGNEEIIKPPELLKRPGGLIVGFSRSPSHQSLPKS
jgi:hypothetical protein